MSDSKNGKVNSYMTHYQTLLKEDSPPENWTKIRQVGTELYEFESKNKRTTLKIFRPIDGEYWVVSILGYNRYQAEYLAGGNSQIHDATRQQAFKLGFDWMKNHPNG